MAASHLLHPGCVVITGANRGIGLEFVKQLLALPKPPNFLFAGCRTPDKAEELERLSSKNSNLKLLQLDVNDISSIESSMRKVGEIVGEDGVNVLLNNAGVYDKSPLESMTVEKMMNSYRTNTVGPLMIARAYLPLLRKAARNSKESGVSFSKAAIGNISSDYGSITNCSGGMYAYKASKAALNMISKGLSEELKSDDIAVLSFHPGWVQTEMGGSTAPTTPQQCVSGLLTVMASVDSSKNGIFINYAGQTLPW